MPVAGFGVRSLWCFADGAAPLFLLPLAGSYIVAGLLFAAGVAAGGIWLARRLCRRPAAGAARASLRALGGAACSAALFSGLVGWMEQAGVWVPVAVAFALAGVALLWVAERRGQGTASRPANDRAGEASGSSG